MQSDISNESPMPTNAADLAQQFQDLMVERQKLDAQIEALIAEYVANAESLDLVVSPRKKPRKKRARNTQE